MPSYGDLTPGFNNLNIFRQPGTVNDNKNDNVAQFNGTVNLDGKVFSSFIPQVVVVTATLAEINAGKTLIAGVDGKSILITGYQAKVSGNFASTTAVLVEDTSGSPVVVATNAVAALTNGAILQPGTSDVTMGAGYLAALAAGEGVVVANSGSAATGGTSITFRIEYTIA